MTGHFHRTGGMQQTNKIRGKNKMRKNEFTLIELLIVITIIAILAGMLLPALGKAKSAAHVITCAGNLKTLSLGITLYCDENDGWFGPINKNSGSSRVYPYIWVNQLYISNYIEAKNRDSTMGYDNGKFTPVLACPFANWNDPLKKSWELGSASYASGDYGFNYYASDVTQGGNNYLQRLSKMKHPSSRLVVADANFFVMINNNYPTVQSMMILYRHNEKANAMAGDGSIQSIKPTKFKLNENFR